MRVCWARVSPRQTPQGYGSVRYITEKMGELTPCEDISEHFRDPAVY
jgi:hypothetical protein